MSKQMGRILKSRLGFTMIELMVVVIIVGVLAAIAIPIYSKYVKNARVTEATGRLGDLLAAAKAYASERESDGVTTTADWPTSASATGFLGDAGATSNFTYTLVGAVNGLLTITATGTGVMGGSSPVKVELKITDPNTNGVITVTGGGLG